MPYVLAWTPRRGMRSRSAGSNGMDRPRPPFDRRAARHACRTRLSVARRRDCASVARTSPHPGAQPGASRSRRAFRFDRTGPRVPDPGGRVTVMKNPHAENKMPRGPGGALGAGGRPDLGRIRPSQDPPREEGIRGRRCVHPETKTEVTAEKLRATPERFIEHSDCYERFRKHLFSKDPTSRRGSLDPPAASGSPVATYPVGPIATNAQPFFSAGAGAGRRCRASPFSTFSASLSA